MMTRNQLYGNGGKCNYCKMELTHKQWITNRTGSEAARLGLNKEHCYQLKQLADAVQLDSHILMKLAIVSKLNEWADDPQKINDEIMLLKLQDKGL